MKYADIRIVIAVAALFFLSACGGGEQKGSAAPAAASAPSAVKKVEVEALKPVVAEKMSEAPLKNPFQSYVLIKRGEIDSSVVIKGPLECCEIATFKVVAALVSGDNPYALVSAADNKRYIVRIGDRIGLNSGKIVSINTGGLTVREQLKDIDGNIVKVNDVKLNVLEGSEQAGAPKSAGR